MVTKANVMSDEEGAERVAARDKGQRPHPDDDPRYECENCGADWFVFYTTCDEEQTVVGELACSCGEHHVAASHSVRNTRTVQEWGGLEVDHHVERQCSCAVQDEESEEQDREVSCRSCFDDAEPDDWTTDIQEWETIDNSDYFELKCDSCGHEIEFGWSHSGRGGRIWPVESSDFNPRKSFPEERFVERWRRRGWLRPAR